MKTTLVHEQWIVGGATGHELAALRVETSEHKGYQIPRAVVQQVAGIVERVAKLAQQHIEEDESRLRLVEELVVNGITHGNGADVRKEVRVKFVMTLDQSDAENPVVHTCIDVDDEGEPIIDGKPAFSVQAEINEALDLANLERPDGRGLLMVKEVMHTDIQGPLPIEGRPGKRMTAVRTDALRASATSESV